MSAIFISYRRADAQGWAGRLAADLADAFGDVARFFDLHSLPPGADYRDAIEGQLAQAAATLVLIGPRWLDLRDAQGARRLDAADDMVSAEVALALAQRAHRPQALLVPVLLGGAAMPEAGALPPALQGLARLNAFTLGDAHWARDVEDLFAELVRATGLRRVARPPAVAAPLAVSIGAKLALEEAEVGDVTGLRGPAGTAAAATVDVLQGAVLRKVKLGNLTGVDLGPAAAADPRADPAAGPAA